MAEKGKGHARSDIQKNSECRRHQKPSSADSMGKFLKRVAVFMELPGEDVVTASCHSIRVRASQDLLTRNIVLGRGDAGGTSEE